MEECKRENDLNKILFDRLFLKKKIEKYFKEKFGMTAIEFDAISTEEKCKKKYKNHFVVRVLKLFDSKVMNERRIKNWNKRNETKKKDYVFGEYFDIDNNKKDDKRREQFYNDIQEQYQNQTKEKLQKVLTWLKKGKRIESDKKFCYYCGISEIVLTELYNDDKPYVCKTKRKRGAWFELDRMNTKGDKNVYTKENMVLCCYFCNNHKSDVISVKDMRKHFGKSTFNFLIEKYIEVIK
jgi:hypothetical protein